MEVSLGLIKHAEDCQARIQISTHNFLCRLMTDFLQLSSRVTVLEVPWVFSVFTSVDHLASGMGEYRVRAQ